jgi:hypothetical protein
MNQLIILSLAQLANHRIKTNFWAFVDIVGLQPFYGKGPCCLLWAGLWDMCGKILINGVPDRLNYCVAFMLYIHNLQMWTQATKYNLAGCGLETCGFCALVRWQYRDGIYTLIPVWQEEWAVHFCVAAKTICMCVWTDLYRSTAVDRLIFRTCLYLDFGWSLTILTDVSMFFTSTYKEMPGMYLD